VVYKIPYVIVFIGFTSWHVYCTYKVYGPETNEMVLQLRKRGIDKIILGGMSANLCTESHILQIN
jgi:nicotinamidase-related amidase